MLTYQMAIDYSIMIKEALSIMLLCEPANDLKYNETVISYDREQLYCTHKGYFLFLIDRQQSIYNRLYIPKTLEHMRFNSPPVVHEPHEIDNEYTPSGLFNDNDERIFLVPMCTEELWDSTVFQLSTLYDMKTVSALLLEPFVSIELRRHQPSHFRSVAQNTHDNSWMKFPFEDIAQNIYCIHSRNKN